MRGSAEWVLEEKRRNREMGIAGLVFNEDGVMGFGGEEEYLNIPLLD